MTNGKYIVCFLYIYGFKHIVKSQTSGMLQEKMTKGYQKAKDIVTKKKNNIPSSYMFSDSIILCYHVVEDRKRLKVLRSCINDIARILDVFVINELPLRGGVAFGEMTVMENIVFGDPLIRAVDYESKINAPLVLLPMKEVTEKLPKGYEGSIKDISAKNIIPLKHEETMLGKLIFPLNKKRFGDFVTNQFVETAKHGPYNVATSWLNASKYLYSHVPNFKKLEYELVDLK